MTLRTVQRRSQGLAIWFSRTHKTGARKKSGSISAFFRTLINMDMAKARSSKGMRLANDRNGNEHESTRNLKHWEDLMKRRKVDASFHHALRSSPFWYQVSVHHEAIMEITTWLDGDQGEKPIFWMCGEQGSGKSGLCAYLAHRFSAQQALAAGFVFDQETDSLALASTFMVNLITEMGEYLGENFAKRAGELADNSLVDRDEIYSRNLAAQFRQILVPAFNGLPAEERKPLFVVIDGIDKITRQGLKLLIEVLEMAVLELPISFFISSCWNEWLGASFERGSLAKWVRKSNLPEKTPTSSTFKLNFQLPPSPTHSLEAFHSAQDFFTTSDHRS
ncbi:hypothetical protein FA15DRAFT_500113 [Coprinopsis marcescibilis]|uniref:Nephrocystin 3-like N-terminal domain-containing protein n=1 Tax=Coprinopsis marcescibilis TaxID=230819 RepID=A0A5C3KQI7_COPMA|nr:hypothetical protein FA15DRAFT_500113 [Coprinopsis marcescibilis]